MDRKCAKTHAKPSDQIVNETLIVKESHSAIWRKMSLFLRVNRRQRIERPAFFSVHVDTYEFVSPVEISST